MTETGRIIDKLGVLLKETGRSFDGNWMVWIRKLDGLLMERVKSIDGSSPVDFPHFGGQKMRFFRVPKPAVSWTPSILQLIFFSILEARKFDFCRVVKPRVQDYQASCEQILRILAS